MSSPGEWFYVDRSGGTQAATLDEIKSWLRDSVFHPESLVWAKHLEVRSFAK